MPLPERSPTPCSDTSSPGSPTRTAASTSAPGVAPAYPSHSALAGGEVARAGSPLCGRHRAYQREAAICPAWSDCGLQALIISTIAPKSFHDAWPCCQWSAIPSADS